MHPNDNQGSKPTPPTTNDPSDRERAISLMREQVRRLYDKPSTSPEAQKEADNSNPYDKTHGEEQGHSASTAQWQRYHTAWQQYYQQYYDRYYRAHHAEFATAMSQASSNQSAPAVSTAKKTTKAKSAEDIAVEEIKNSLRNNIETQSKRIRQSRHFIPVISALVVMSLFLILQYNRVIIAQVKTFVSPGSIATQNIVIDPSRNTAVPPEPRIIIPKINVDAPIVYDVPSLDEPVVQDSLKRGVIHYPIPGANSNPGQLGNAVFMGHSSNDVFDDGDYKFIFVQLEQLKPGDKFYLHYNSTRYTYSVRSTEVIYPNEVRKLVLDNDKPMATLITCTPVGTAEKRFLVFAEQISPDPTEAKVATPATGASEPVTISGNSPTLFDRLFGF